MVVRLFCDWETLFLSRSSARADERDKNSVSQSADIANAYTYKYNLTWRECISSSEKYRKKIIDDIKSRRRSLKSISDFISLVVFEFGFGFAAVLLQWMISIVLWLSHWGTIMTLSIITRNLIRHSNDWDRIQIRLWIHRRDICCEDYDWWTWITI